MKFGICCSAIFLVCLVSLEQSVAFKLQAVKTNQNEINLPIPGQYYIQNFATGLVIGALTAHNDSYDIPPVTMESVDGVDQKSMLLWEMETKYMPDFGVVTYFRSLGPNTQSELQKLKFCIIGGCSVQDMFWALLSRGEGIWEIRLRNYFGDDEIPDKCATGYGLHQNVNLVNTDCDPNNPLQTWQLIRHDLN